MDILIEPDCYKVCRICMESCEDDFVCVYDEFEDNILMDVIAECARVEIRKDDALPRNACRNCAEYMIIAYHIIQKCRDSDQTLRSIFKHEIDLRSRKDEQQIFGTTSAADINEEDLNPEEYEFLLSEAYDNMILDSVEELIAGEAGEEALSDRFPTPPDEGVRYGHEGMEFVMQEHCGPPATVDSIKAEQTMLGNAPYQENVPPQLEHQQQFLQEQQQQQLQQQQEDCSPKKKCCGCKKEFDNESDLMIHSNLVHFNEHQANSSELDKPFKCPVCYKPFSNVQLLKEHQRTAIRRYFCRKCGKGFMTEANLENHLKSHSTSGEMKKCCGCRSEFETDAELLRHSQEFHKTEQIFNPEKPFECQICYRRYPTRKSLVSHKRLNQQHQCAFCGEIFMKKIFLAHHERTYHPHAHQPEDPKRRCCGCRAEFPNPQALTEHSLASHKPQQPLPDEAKPFECDTCFKRFSSKFSLHQHKKKANQEKRFVCEVCGRSFGRAFDKANHATTHSTEAPFPCHICPRRFKNKLYLKNHLKLHAIGDSKDFVCHECGKCFRTKDLLKTHSITHSEERKFSCPFCPATFKRMQCLKIHHKVHTKEKAYECPTCGRRYTQSSDLKRHMLTHNAGESAKPFQCEYCLKRYPRKDYLKIHIRKQHLEKADMILLDDVAALEFAANNGGDENEFLLMIGDNHEELGENEQINL